MRKLITPLFIMLLALTGCDNNDLLQSEEKVNNQVNGRWKKVFATTTEPYSEKWKFDNGTLTVTREKQDTTYVDHGRYTVSTKFSKSFIVISGLTSEAIEYYDLNRNWTIAEINSHTLYISTTNNTGAIISREFIKD